MSTTNNDRPMIRLTVPITEGIQHSLVLAAREAREHYAGIPHRRLGYQYKDASLTAWFGEEVTP
jgi:hypothetical protein